MRFLSYRTAKYEENVLRSRDYEKQLNNSPQPQDYAGEMNSHVVLIMRSSMFIRSRSPQSPYLKLPNEEREQRLPTLQENPAKRIRNESDEERKHLKFTVKIIFFDATISSTEIHDLQNAREEYLSNGLRTADQPLHHDQQWVLQ